MIKVCALASGSNGNCYYIESGEEAILIDAGISRRQIIERMKQKGLNPNKVTALFITHEHSDHYRGAKVLSAKLSIPVFITSKTVERGFYTMRPERISTFEVGDTIEYGVFKVHSFSKHHDAIDPCSFRVEVEGNNVGVFTDIGEPCDNVKQHLNLCDFLFLEANYDEDLLWQGKYPPHLKKRVAGIKGHLSNKQAVELIEGNASAQLKHIYLSHISEDNNRGEIAMNAFEHLKENYNIQLTSRYAAGDVIELNS